jgi:membrane-associated phospholipid phosphatase
MKITASAVRVSALFWTIWILVYPACNYIASCRSDVHCFYFEWEHALPFVPWLIIPYLSIDVFLALLPLIIKDEKELWTYGHRMVTATLIAGAFFLLLPMKFGWPRPPVDSSSFVGWINTTFRAMDLPYNQCPSLHVAYLLIMFGPFMRNTRGPLRIGIAAWFGLILVSTLFTYQHHCVDVLGGFALGALSICLLHRHAESGKVPHENAHEMATSRRAPFELQMEFPMEAEAVRR